MTAWIDGRAIEAQPGETILAAAERLGIAIPTVCFVPRLPPSGGCRRCLVEVALPATQTGSDPDWASRLEAACHAPLADGARVTTQSPRLSALRAQLDAFDRAASPASAACDESHPYLVFDASRCIACRRCVQVCEEIPGRAVWSVAGEHGAPRIACDGPGPLGESSCVACGA